MILGIPARWRSARGGVPRLIRAGDWSAVRSIRIGTGRPRSLARPARASKKRSVVGTKLGQLVAQAPQRRQSSNLARTLSPAFRRPSATASSRATLPRAAIPSYTVFWYSGQTDVQEPHLLHLKRAAS